MITLKNIIIAAFALSSSLLSMGNHKEQEIIEAVQKNQHSKIKDLVEKDANLITTVTPRLQEKLIHIAPTIETMQILLELGANVNSLDMYGRTPLHLALNNGQKYFDRTKFLLSNNADITITDKAGETPVITVLKEIITDTYKSQKQKNPSDIYQINFREPNNKNLRNYFTNVLTLLADNQKFDLKELHNAIKKYAHIMAQDPSELDIHLSVKNLWTAFILYALLEPMNKPFIVKTYDTLKEESWFQQLPVFPLLSVINDMFAQKIDNKTAVAFLKIDQKNPPQDFKDKNLERIQNAYSFAKKYDLKQPGAYMLNYMKSIAGLAGALDGTHDILGGPEDTITSFTRIDDGDQEPYLTKEQSVKNYAK